MNNAEATRLVAEQLDRSKAVAAAWLVWAPDPDSAEQVLCELGTGETLSVTVEILSS